MEMSLLPLLDNKIIFFQIYLFHLFLLSPRRNDIWHHFLIVIVLPPGKFVVIIVALVSADVIFLLHFKR